jgi:hypothetical protein
MIFLDFDGVLVDSNAETIKNFFYAIEATFKRPISNKDKKIIKDQILLVRGNIGPIRDFFLEYKRIIKDDHRLEDYDPKIIDKKLNLLVKNFLKNRSQSKLKDLEAWEGLHKPTKIVKTLQKIPGKFILVSTKDEGSLLDLSNSLQIKPLSIYGKEAYEFHGSKKNIILKIIKEENYSKNIFIDDNEEHLFKAKNIHSFFANWGYGYYKNFDQLDEPEAKQIILSH